MQAGVKTLPTLIGNKAAKIVAYVAITIGCVALLLPLYFNLFKPYYLVGAIPAILVCAYSTRLKPGSAHKAIKVAMYLAIVGFLIGAVL